MAERQGLRESRRTRRSTSERRSRRRTSTATTSTYSLTGTDALAFEMLGEHRPDHRQRTGDRAGCIRTSPGSRTMVIGHCLSRRGRGQREHRCDHYRHDPSRQTTDHHRWRWLCRRRRPVRPHPQRGRTSSGPSTHDIEELDPGHDTPSGLWSDAMTLWILENGSGSDDADLRLRPGDRRTPSRIIEFDARRDATARRAASGPTARVRLGLRQRPRESPLRPRPPRAASASPGARHRTRRRATAMRAASGPTARRYGCSTAAPKNSLFAYDLESGNVARRVRARMVQNDDPPRRLVRRNVTALGVGPHHQAAPSPTAFRRGPLRRRGGGRRRRLPLERIPGEEFPKVHGAHAAPATTARAASGPMAT